MPLFLGSQSLAALPPFLARAGRGPKVAFVPTAANRLEDREAMVAGFRKRLVSMALELEDVDLDELSSAAIAAAIRAADVVFVGGGDPFHLLARARERGFVHVVREAVARGVPYVGVSAGAMVAGPSLEPATATSPFAAPPDMPLEGFGLTELVILPHHNRPGRAARNGEAARIFGGRYALVPLRDHEAIVIEGGPPVFVDSAGSRRPIDGSRA
jgi:dipeptidase E